MARGQKTGGRTKGTENKVTAEMRAMFKAVFEKRLADLDRWIIETGDGFEATHFLADGTSIPYLERNPGKAAELLTRLAEFHIPKLQRTTIDLSVIPIGEIEAEVSRREAQSDTVPDCSVIQ
jgi:hypothetical protein